MTTTLHGRSLDQYGAALHLIHDAGRKAARQARVDLVTGKITASAFADLRRRQMEAVEKRMNMIWAHWAEVGV